MMKWNNKKVFVLGTEYQIQYESWDEYTDKGNSDGYIDVFDKVIHILKIWTQPNTDFKYGDVDTNNFIKKLLRHELIHAFLEESGLANNSNSLDIGWARNEEMVDWMAIQIPKIMRLFMELDIC